jgi:hypothetical protein
MTMNERWVISGGIKKIRSYIKIFLNDNRPFLDQLGKSLLRLSPEDKKQVINVLLKEKIRVFGNETDHWRAEKPTFRFNKEILGRLIEDCKLLENLGLVQSQLNKSSHLQKEKETEKQYLNLLNFLVSLDGTNRIEVFDSNSYR